MVKRYERPLMPPEFKRWIEERKKNLERIAREAGRKKPISLMKTMRIISRTDGINLPEEIVKELKGIRIC